MYFGNYQKERKRFEKEKNYLERHVGDERGEQAMCWLVNMQYAFSG